MITNNTEVKTMSDNWGRKLKGFLNELIDRLYRFLGPDDSYEYVGDGISQGEVDIKLHLSVKIRRK